MITLDEDYPGVFVTRQPRSSGVKLYGPFTSVYALKEAVTLLQKAFKFRTCHLDIREADDKRRFFRPCLLYPIKQCTAPCAAKVSKELLPRGHQAAHLVPRRQQAVDPRLDGKGHDRRQQGPQLRAGRKGSATKSRP